MNKMFCKILIVFTLVSHAISDSCVRYTFEENYNELFGNQREACANSPIWSTGNYSDLDFIGQNERSNSFITPLSQLSCVSSFIFAMNSGGTLEVNIYMDGMEMTDFIIILTHMLHVDGDRVTGEALSIPLNENFEAGWQTLTITLTGAQTYEGYMSIMGRKSRNSTVLVDSFRYIPPGMDVSKCQLYEDLPKPNHPRFNGFKA